MTDRVSRPAAAVAAARRRRPGRRLHRCAALAARGHRALHHVDLLDEIVPRRPQWRRHVVAALQLLGLSAGVIAIARPITTTTERTVSEGRIILPSTCRCRWRRPTSPRTASPPPSRRRPTSSTRSPTTSRSGWCPSAARSRSRCLRRSTAPIDHAIAGLQLDDATAIGDALITSTNLLVQLQGAGPEATPDGRPTGSRSPPGRSSCSPTARRRSGRRRRKAPLTRRRRASRCSRSPSARPTG